MLSKSCTLAAVLSATQAVKTENKNDRQVMMVVDVPDDFNGPNFTAVRPSRRHGVPMPFAFDKFGNEFADIREDMAAAQ